MKDESSRPTVESLIEVIHRKLEANRPILSKSLNYGRLIWRTDQKTGEIDVDLELKV